MNKISSIQFRNMKFGQRGVTLIETIVALGILTLGLVTSLSLMVSSINFSQNSEQLVVVVNLAREGIEITRSIRELSGFTAVAAGARLASINYISGNLELLAADSANIAQCDNCQLEMYEGRYLHNSPGEDTIFKRLITVTDESSNEKKVVSQVYWSERGRSHTFTLEDHLTNW